MSTSFQQLSDHVAASGTGPLPDERRLALYGELVGEAEDLLALAGKLTDQALATSERVRVRIAVAAAVCLVLALGVNAVIYLMIVPSIISPILALRTAVRDIGAGHLDRRLPAASRDEIGELTAEFDAMREKLHKSRDELLAANTRLTAEVAERERAQQDLKRKAEALERSNLELEQFAYIASHDLQEPLRMVYSYCDLLKRRYSERLSPEADEYIRFAHDGASRMKEMIQALLEFSRLHKSSEKLEPVDCESALEASLASLQAAVEETSARITWHDLPAVMGDAANVRRLFQNLIGNAIKYHGEAPPEVTVFATQEDQWVHFTVSDNGIGIDAKDFERIFEIFKRLHSRVHYSGNGIGLAICKRIVETLGGSIWVDSEPGKGSSFHFSLPAYGDAAPCKARLSAPA